MKKRLTIEYEDQDAQELVKFKTLCAAEEKTLKDKIMELIRAAVKNSQ